MKYEIKTLMSQKINKYSNFFARNKSNLYRELIKK
jgi:hypothetical protein